MSTPKFARRPAPQHSGPPPVSALNTTCEGVWILQGLCGVELLPATLLLRPWVTASGPPTDHAGIPVLREAGVLVDDETVHPKIALWLETLGAPDIELCANIQRGEEHMRLVVARREGRHVAASRCGDDVTIEEVPNVGSPRDLLERILALCGATVEPAQFDPITVRTGDFLDGLGQVVRGDHTANKILGGLGLTVEQRRIVMLAAEDPWMQVSFALVLHDSRGDHVAMASASVTDTEAGRMVAGPIRGDDGTWWTQIVPGTLDAGARALKSLVATVGIASWHDHSRQN
ncbi:MAG: ESX secretion-associated protein EspG [Mycobacteriaceae bacterium]|nr:ESX secretion-associated protein EspG [Mycobacteriaceae bacterium]